MNYRRHDTEAKQVVAEIETPPLEDQQRQAKAALSQAEAEKAAKSVIAPGGSK